MMWKLRIYYAMDWWQQFKHKKPVYALVVLSVLVYITENLVDALPMLDRALTAGDE